MASRSPVTRASWTGTPKSPADVLAAVAALAIGLYITVETLPLRILSAPITVLFLVAVVPAVVCGALAADRARPLKQLDWRLVGGAAFAVLVGAAALTAWATMGHRLLSPTRLGVVLAAAGSAGAGLAWGRLIGRRLRVSEILALEVLAAMALADAIVIRTPAVTDLLIYLKAGEHFLHGQPVYITAPLPVDPALHQDLPFLYPPPTLPLFAALAVLPQSVAIALFLGLSLVAGVAALRWLGLGWRTLWVALAWPPFFHGLTSGNVVIPTFLIVGIGPAVASVLTIGSIFKLQAGVPALWLVQERRWRSLAIGIVALVLLALVTLPIVGLDSWRAWIGGLEAFQRSNRDMLGRALPRYVPDPAYIAIAALAVLAALTRRGRLGLAALFAASAIASPSLYDHGFLAALPAMLLLDGTLLWVGLGLTSVLTGWGWWPMLLLAFAAPFVPVLRRRTARPDDLHLLGAERGPWPAASNPSGMGATLSPEPGRPSPS